MELKIIYDGGVITDEELQAESFTLKESLCSNNQLYFGTCEASYIEFDVSYIYQALKGKRLTVLADGVCIGYFYVYSDKPNADKNYRHVLAYDLMYDILNRDVTSWYRGLKLPMSVKAFRDSFFSYIGVGQVATSLVNDGQIVGKTTNDDRISGAMVLSGICELNGVFGHINREEKLEYISLAAITEGLYPSDDLYPADDLYPSDESGFVVSDNERINADYEDYLVNTIDSVQICDYGNSKQHVEGTGANTYIIKNNLLVSSEMNLATAAKNFLNKVKVVEYRPYECDAIGNLNIQVGDVIVTRGKYEIIHSYVLERTFKGIVSVKDFYAARGKEYRLEDLNSIEERVFKAETEINSINNDVYTTDERGHSTTKIEILDGKISLEISRAAIAESDLSTRISVNDSEISYQAGRISSVAQEISLQGQSISAQASQISALADTVAVQAETIALQATQLSAKADRIDLKGFVTIEDLNGSKTIIDGSSIKTGTISADKLDIAAIRSKVFSADISTSHSVNITGGALYVHSGSTLVIGNQSFTVGTISYKDGDGSTKQLTTLVPGGSV